MTALLSPASRGTSASSSLPPQQPAGLDHQVLVVRDVDRDRGIRLGAGSGSGKTVWLGKVLVFLDFLRGVPQVVWDPLGPLTDTFLLCVARLPEPIRRRLWPRIVYVDMAGATADRVVSFPLLFDLGGESRRDIADRFLVTIKKLDPHLQSASIQGWNALYRIGAPVGIVLAALGRQLDDAEDLLRNPATWDLRFEEAIRRFPEAAPAVEFLRHEYTPLRPAERLRLANAYLGKLAPLMLDPAMRQMFTTAPAGIDFASIIANRQTVILDFRRETNIERRRFKARWVFEYLMAFVRHRGAGRHTPLGIVIDELTELTNQASLEHDLFSTDLDELVNVIGRNANLWTTLAHQELFQMPERVRKTLLTMGTQIVGVTADMEAARDLAYQYAPLNPHRVKRWENVWGSKPSGAPYVIEERPVDFPVDEQILLAAQRLAGLKPFEFLVKHRHGRTLQRVNARSLIAGPWPSEHVNALAYVRYQLALRVGRQRLALPAAPPQLLDPATVDVISAGDDDDVIFTTVTR